MTRFHRLQKQARRHVVAARSTDERDLGISPAASTALEAVFGDFGSEEPPCLCVVSTPWATRRLDKPWTDSEGAPIESRTCLACNASNSMKVLR